MNGIMGLKMWMEDFMMNASSYPKDYQTDFLKIKNLWNECVKQFKNCKTISECNDTYMVYSEKVDSLRETLLKYYGINKMPIGIADTLDYFEEAVGDLEDKAINKITDSSNFTVVLPKDYNEFLIRTITRNKDYIPGKPYKANNLEFYIKNNKLTVKGDFWDVRSFLEDRFSYEEMEEIIDEGVVENA